MASGKHSRAPEEQRDLLVIINEDAEYYEGGRGG